MNARALATSAARLENPTYAALRVVAGAMFAFHGAQKILGWLATNPRPAVGTQLWFGGLIELGCGSLVALGLFTRAAAFLAAGRWPSRTSSSIGSSRWRASPGCPS